LRIRSHPKQLAISAESAVIALLTPEGRSRGIARLGPLVTALLLGAAAGYAVSSRNAIELRTTLDRQSKQIGQLTEEVARLNHPRALPLANGNSIDVDALADQLSLRLRREGNCATAAETTRDPSAPAAATQAAFTADPDALVQGQHLVDDALRSGHWSEQQASALRALIPRIGGDHHQQFMMQLIVPINDGRIIVDGTGPPF